MATTHPDIRQTGSDWVNIVTLDGNLSGVALTIQNKGDQIHVVFGGTEPSEPNAGNIIEKNVGINGTSTAIWVRGRNGFVISPLEND